MFTFRRKKQRELYAPLNGCGIALDDVRDEVFSKRLMGMAVHSFQRQRAYVHR